MKKKLTISIIVGFASVILGLVLAGIGFFSGGLEKLENISQPQEIHKSYANLSSLTFEYLPQSVLIQESPDNRYHVSYYNSPNNLHSSIRLNKDKDNLSLSIRSSQIRIKGFLQVFGEVLAERNLNSQIITIQIPKNKSLKKLKGFNGNSITIENSKIETIDFDGNINLMNSEIAGGNINGYSLNIQQSKLKNLTISSPSSPNYISNSTLENVTISDYHQLDAQQVTLLGENTFKPISESLTLTNLDLTDKNLAELSLNISNKIDKAAFAKEFGYTYEGEENPDYEDSRDFQNQVENMGIFIRDKYANLPITATDTEVKLTTQVANSKNKLTINTTNATINLRTPQ
ncbi:hypothetical protein K6V78_02615 [Streptococcus gallolyticus]|uniref:DUF4097 family beta strand repeat-containing protein n=1 Tax=Streptococcus hepaticus TaxID=3349163 RepID=UPI001C98B60A|nr:hypothetical protein [Streptococcus gallolyticus]MBY5040532.1 hypothetical protein [Streptococcus gallolyticus]